MKCIAIFLSIFIASPVVAQGANANSASSAVGTAGSVWKSVSNYLVRAAEQMPEADYAFRPTADVRSFGQLIGHVAGAQYMMCAVALGEKDRPENDIEKTKTTKAELVEALKASSEYCARAYAQSDADASAMTKIYGQDHTKLWVLVSNATHDNEHYGNIVTYMRIKGMVPPSSQPRR